MSGVAEFFQRESGAGRATAERMSGQVGEAEYAQWWLGPRGRRISIQTLTDVQ